MRYLLPLIMAAGIMMLAACKETKKSEDIITTKYVPKKPKAPIAMSEEHLVDNVQWMGSTYRVKVDRVPSDSLPMLSDEIGQKYIDNYITVSILRSDQSVFFKRTFTKNSFASYLTADYKKTGLLSSIRFSEVDGKELEFSVIIAHPDALDDEYLPLEMSINNMQGIAIEVDNDMLDDFDEADDNDDDDGV
jgi:hypothetical protein